MQSYVFLLQQPTQPDFAGSLARIATSAKTLLESLSSTVESSFQEPITWLAAVFGAVLISTSVARLIRENDGASIDLVYWLIRLTVCASLFTAVTPAFRTLDELRDEVMSNFRNLQGPGGQPASPTALARLQFDRTFEKFTTDNFTEQRASGTTEETVGRLWDIDKPWYQNIDRVLNPADWDPPRMFSFLTIARALLAFSEVAVEILWAFVRLALFLAAPLMVAAAIDRQIANRITYPYLWGLAVFYVVWPPVADVIRLVAYKAATLTLESFARPLQTPSVSELGNPMLITHVGTVDGYAVMAGCAVMLIGALMQFGSPFIAYRLSQGQVFEAISSSVSGWIAAITGTAAELYGARVSADLDRAARMSEVRGSYEASVTRATHARDSSLLGAQANKRMAEASARSSQIAGLAGVQAVLRNQTGANNAANRLQTNLLGSGTRASIESNEANRSLQTGTTENNKNQRVGELDNRRGWGQAEIGMGTVSNVIRESLGDIPIGGGIARGATTLTEGGARMVINNNQFQGLKNIQRGAAAIQSDIYGTYYDRLNRNQTQLLGEQSGAYDTYNREVNQVAVESAGIQQGGINRSFGEMQAGIHDAYGLNTRAAATLYEGDVKGATIMRDAGARAAELHQVAAIVHSVTRDVDRRLEQAMALRY